MTQTTLDQYILASIDHRLNMQDQKIATQENAQQEAARKAAMLPIEKISSGLAKQRADAPAFKSKVEYEHSQSLHAYFAGRSAKQSV